MTTTEHGPELAHGFKVTVKARMYHGVLQQTITRLGMTQAEAADYLGISAFLFGDMIRLKRVPDFTRKNGKKLKQKLEELTETPVSELFPNAIFTDEFLGKDKTVEVTREVPVHLLANASIVHQLSLPPDETLMRKEGEGSKPEDMLDEVLNSLSEKEQKVLRLRFMENNTLEECGGVLNLSKDRIRQIEAKALRKMRHPTRIRRLWQ